MTGDSSRSRRRTLGSRGPVAPRMTVAGRAEAVRTPAPPPVAEPRLPGAAEAGGPDDPAYTRPMGRQGAASTPSASEAQMRMVQAQEAERSRLARELHDGPTQVLANAVFQVEIIERLLERDEAEARRELHKLRATFDRELKAMRGYLGRLRAPVLADLGLTGALREAAAQLEAQPGIPVTVAMDPGLDELPESIELVIFRIVQEALQNIRKHALARRASVRATHLQRAWKVEIRDDGRGFDLESTRRSDKPSYGLRFMQERADMIGARFEVRSRDGGGTVVTLVIPWAAKESR